MAKNDKATTEVAATAVVAVPAPGALTPEAAALIAEFNAAVQSMIADDTNLVANTLLKMLQAPDMDSIFDAEPEDGEADSTVTKLANIIGEVFTITNVELRASELEDSTLGCYAVMHTTEYGVVTSGATQVVGGLVSRKIKADKAGVAAWPVTVKAREKKTKKGNPLRWLEHPSAKSVEQQRLKIEGQSGSF